MRHILVVNHRDFDTLKPLAVKRQLFTGTWDEVIYALPLNSEPAFCTLIGSKDGALCYAI